MGREDGAKAAAATAAARACGGAMWNVMLLGTMIATNMLALYCLSIAKEVDKSSAAAASVLQELAAMREEMRGIQRTLLQHLQQQDSSSTSLQQQQQQQQQVMPSSSSINLAPELAEFIEAKRLPLGKNPNYGLDTMVSPIGHHCFGQEELLNRYMSYSPGEDCPDDWDIAQALMVRGCEPLPRRRCFAAAPRREHYTEPAPRPASFWMTPSDGSVSWTHYTCKSFDCLKNRAKNSKVFLDCADCFDLEGPERRRWTNAGAAKRDEHDFDLDEVVTPGIRIGLDIGGGAGSFAARMAERNVTILTSTLNLNGPFNEFVAARGLLPLFLTVSQRLPFFDNTLDIVHSMHVLSSWLPLPSLEFLLFDVDRVLRPKGLLWLDRFFCTQEQLEQVYAPLLAKLRYTKRKWVTGRKLDRNGVLHNEVYLSALLQKP